MGYRNKTLRVNFDDLGDGCYVEMRNPKLIPRSLLPSAQIAVGEDGKPASPEDQRKAEQAGLDLLTSLVTDWCVWDIDDDTQVLQLPSENRKVWDRVPLDIQNRLMVEVSESANPS